MVKFIKGKRLSELFFKEIVKPLLKIHYPYLKYSAGLLGAGSDVIDFDTARSMDHDWGPRMILFLLEEDFKQKKKISKMFKKYLQKKFRNFSTRIVGKNNEHRIEILTIRLFFRNYLNFNIKKDITAKDWLTFSEHKLLTITAGTVYYDEHGLKKEIERFHYYPKDIWYYLLASQWTRISQEEHFMGRCGELNDEIGSRIIATRLVKDIMKMCFLIKKQYTPYIKWFGTGFNKLKSSKKLKPILKRILKSEDWKNREKYLSQAYEYIAKQHNSLNITRPIIPKVSCFHKRPFLVIHAEIIATQIRNQIKDPIIKSIKLNIESVNQFLDSTDALESNTQLFKSAYD